MLQVSYVGSQGHRLLAIHDINYGNPQTCLDLNMVLGAGTCAPFGEDVTYNIPANTIPPGVTFHLPNGQTVAGPNAQALTITGTRRLCHPERPGRGDKRTQRDRPGCTKFPVGTAEPLLHSVL